MKERHRLLEGDTRARRATGGVDTGRIRPRPGRPPHREPRRMGGMLVPDGRNQPCRDHDERRSGLPAQARLAALELRARPGDERAAHSRKLERRADKDARRYPRADRPGHRLQGAARPMSSHHTHFLHDELAQGRRLRPRAPQYRGGWGLPRPIRVGGWQGAATGARQRTAGGCSGRISARCPDGTPAYMSGAALRCRHGMNGEGALGCAHGREGTAGSTQVAGRQSGG